MASLRLVAHTLIANLSIVLCSFAQEVQLDVVRLKNGSIIRGVIIQEVPDSIVVIRTQDGISFTFQMYKVAKITKEPLTGKQDASSRSEKSPVLAGALSLVVPGAGQIYNGELLWGILHTSLAAGGIVVALTLGSETVSEYVRTGTKKVRDRYGNFLYYEPTYGYEYYDRDTPWLYVGLGVSGATLIWSVIDAIYTARAHNEEIRSMQNSGRIIGNVFILVPQRGGVKAQLRLTF